MKKVFIGIDFSKLKFDAAIYSVDTKAIVSTEVFDNEQSGYADFLHWVKENTRCQKSGLLFCGEHTGYYSGNLSVLLYESGYSAAARDCIVWQVQVNKCIVVLLIMLEKKVYWILC